MPRMSNLAICDSSDENHPEMLDKPDIDLVLQLILYSFLIQIPEFAGEVLCGYLHCQRDIATIRRVKYGVASERVADDAKLHCDIW